MNWTREKPGVYTAGPYRVEQGGASWYATGPGLKGEDFGEPYPRKDQAQGRCCQVAGERADWRSPVDPVIRDVVRLTDGRQGYVSVIMRGPVGVEHVERAMYGIRLPRGRRLCLFRHEFAVVVP